MLQFHGFIAAALLLTVGLSPAANSAEHMKSTEEMAIVIDAPDLFKVPESAIGPRFSTLAGKPVYSNAGKRIGEIEDFVLAKGGEMYAVIDTSAGPLEKLIEITNDEIVVVPLRELRRAPLSEAKAMAAP